MNVIYEYFNNIIYFAPLITITYIHRSYIRQYFNGNLFKYKSINNLPFSLKVKAAYNRSLLGKLSIRTTILIRRLNKRYISNLMHKKLISSKSRLIANIPRGYLKISIFLAFVISYSYKYGMQNPYVLYISMHKNQDEFGKLDMSYNYIHNIKNGNYPNKIIEEEISNNALLISKYKNNYNYYDNTTDIYNNSSERNNSNGLQNYSNLINYSEYVKYGKLFSSVFQEEISNQCYYIAYLKNRSIGANSELKFKTAI